MHKMINVLSVIEFIVEIFALIIIQVVHFIYRIFFHLIILNQNRYSLFFFQIGFLLFSFLLFLSCYSLMFPEMEKGELPNPPQVIAQLCSFFFLFKYPEERVRERHLLLLSLFFSFLSSLYLKGQGLSYGILFIVPLFCLIVIHFFPLDSDLALFLFFSFYCFDVDMSKWGFYLIFQQFCFFLLALFFKKEQPCPNPKKLLLYFLSIETILLFNGLFHYNAFYLAEPFKLAILLSGTCIIYICIQKRTKFELGFCFVLYFFLSLLMGVIISPTNTKTVWGIPYGIFIFLSLHLWSLFGLIFFWHRLPRRKQALVPLFFSGLFFLLGFFPELARLEKWISGIDLLLCILSVFSLLEEETYKQSREGNSPDRTLRSLSNHLVEKEVIER